MEDFVIAATETILDPETHVQMYLASDPETARAIAEELPGVTDLLLAGETEAGRATLAGAVETLFDAAAADDNSAVLCLALFVAEQAGVTDVADRVATMILADEGMEGFSAAFAHEALVTLSDVDLVEHDTSTHARMIAEQMLGSGPENE